MKIQKYTIAKTFKVNESQLERIKRLRELTRLNQSVLLDTALEILEIQLQNGKTIQELLFKIES